MTWTNEFLDHKRSQGDPIADALIANLIAQHGETASRNIFDKLISNIDLPVQELPDGIQEFMQVTAQLPDWLTDDDLKKSNRFFVDHGPKLLLLLYFKSLPLLYSNAKGAPVLVKTSRLTHDTESMEIFARRIAETGQFLLNVMANDNFKENNIAVNSIRKVRLIHAAIRHFIAKEWDSGQLGTPINQEDMALTLMTFSISLIDGLGQLLISENETLIQAYFDRWRAIGLLLGIDSDLIPETMEEGRLLLNTVLERNSATSDAGQLLTKALIEFSKNSIPGKIMDITPESLITYFTGREMASQLGVSTQTGCLGMIVPSFLASLFNIGENLEGNASKIHYISDRLSSKLTQAMVNYFDRYKKRSFIIPAEFEAKWKGG